MRYPGVFHPSPAAGWQATKTPAMPGPCESPRVTRPIMTVLLMGLLMVLALLSGCAGPQLKTEEQTGLSYERTMILTEAKKTLGVPYRYGGNSLSGLDCSGLVQRSYSKAGIKVPRTSSEQFSALPPIKKARPGDLLFFDTSGGGKASHVGIYLGNDQMIHAPGSGREVTTTQLSLDYWQKRFLGAAGPAP